MTIDNLDGLGAVDYSACLEKGAKVVRVLNEPSVFEARLVLEGTGLEGAGLATPVRRGRVVVTADAGATLFTGYLTTEPVGVYAGAAAGGVVYRLALRAVSDEWLLDQQAGATRIGAGLGATVGASFASLTGRLGVRAVTAAGGLGGRPVGVFEPAAAAAWSTNAGALAGAAYAGYRALGGAVGVVPVGAVTHTFADGDGTLNVGALATAAVKELANDVTVSGAMEPATYWTEVFAGDGTTAEFVLTGEPAAATEGAATLIADTFRAGMIDRETWVVGDSGAHISLGAAGLVIDGGNGLDGQTTLTALDALELGGTVVLELGSVVMGPGSAGVLGGLYDGVVAQTNCFAGFNVRQSGGNTIATAMVDGVEVGASFPMLEGHAYTLRLRLHCAEMLRVKQAYYAAVADAGTGLLAVEAFGGGLVDAAMDVCFEARDLGEAANDPVTVLYDGAVAASPASCTLVAVDSLALVGSVGSVAVRRTGSCWVRGATAQTGAAGTRLIGKAGEGVDCRLGAGKVTFFAGRVPGVGDTVSVSYRGRRRAVARMMDVASVAAEAAGGGSGTARWLGKVVRPAARCAEDCESAAQAVLRFAANRAAAVAGSYVAVNPAGGDLWPGDFLALAQADTTVSVIARRVTVEDACAVPEVLTYTVAFANEWAEGLGVRLSEALATDALVPAAALDASVAERARVLGNLPGLTVVAHNGAVLTMDAGLDPPVGGGFEVRRHDGGFGSGTAGSAAGDLVLRSPVRGFQIPVTEGGEAFFVRMYDSSVPAVYSRVSSAVLTQLPI